MDAGVDVVKLGLVYTCYRTPGAGMTELFQYHDSSKKSQYEFSFRPKTAAIWPRQLDLVTSIHPGGLVPLPEHFRLKPEAPIHITGLGMARQLSAEIRFRAEKTKLECM